MLLPKAMAVCIDWEKTTPSVLNAGAKSGAYNGRADEACHSLSGEQCGRYTYNKCRDRGCRVTGQQCVLVDVNGRNALTLDEAWQKNSRDNGMGHEFRRDGARRMRAQELTDFVR